MILYESQWNQNSYILWNTAVIINDWILVNVPSWSFKCKNINFKLTLINSRWTKSSLVTIGNFEIFTFHDEDFEFLKAKWLVFKTLNKIKLVLMPQIKWSSWYKFLCFGQLDGSLKHSSWNVLKISHWAQTGDFYRKVSSALASHAFLY